VPEVLPVVAVLIVLAGYLAAAVRERSRRGWSGWRAAAFTAGALALAWPLSPAFDAHAEHSFSAHMAQHLLLAMVGPLGLVLGAPLTLALRTLPRPAARALGRALRSRPLHVLANPWLALLLATGGTAALYLTPLYAATTRSELVHGLVHLHFVLSGYLFAWVVAGPDPAPGRPSVPTRLVVLGVSIAVHASLAQLLYAGLLVHVHEPAAQLRAAGDLMYVGGDTAELLLALALLLTWRRPPQRTARPSAGGAAAAARSARTAA
jgi:putative membrane protein